MKTGFQFSETMAGTMELAARPGAEVPFAFTVTARAPSLREHLRDGRAELRGTVEAPGLAAAAEATGELTIRLLRGRRIRYELGFTGDDGRRYRFAGQKDLRWLEPLRSWTTLPGEITDEDGRVVARCRTRFDLASDWLAFASSWRPA
jgi:hypothetical protein